MAKSVSVFCLLFFFAPVASAEIFKCVTKDGLPLYQNFPCGIDSIGSTATNAPSDKAGLAQSDSKQAKANASAPTEPRVGMTPDEVRAMWGEPAETFWEEPGVGARSELWSYSNSRSVRFVKNRVSAIEK